MLLARNYKAGGHRPPLQRKPRNYVHVIERHYTPRLAARGRSRKDGFPTVGAVCDRPHFVNSRKKARSQTAPTIDTANSADFCQGLLGDWTIAHLEWSRVQLNPNSRCRIGDEIALGRRFLKQSLSLNHKGLPIING